MNSGSDSSFFIFATPPNTPKTSGNTVSLPKTSNFISTNTPTTPSTITTLRKNNPTQIQELEEKFLLTPLTPSSSTIITSKSEKKAETIPVDITQKASTIQETTPLSQQSSLSIQEPLSEQSTTQKNMSVLSANTPSILERRKIKKLYIGGETASKESTTSHHQLKYTLFNTNNTADFPVVVLPGLYLGDKATSGDYECLKKHQIRHVVNVTPDLDNVFEGCSDIRYLRVPIHDHSWNQQHVQQYLNRAVSFIDECRQKKQCVLVHCMVGMNRSVAVTVAYLMHHLKLPLDEAFDKLGALRASINPNLSIMHHLNLFANLCSGEGGGNGDNDVNVGGVNEDGGGEAGCNDNVRVLDSAEMKCADSLNEDVSSGNNTTTIINPSNLYHDIDDNSKVCDNKINNNDINNDNYNHNIDTLGNNTAGDTGCGDNTNIGLKEGSPNEMADISSSSSSSSS